MRLCSETITFGERSIGDEEALITVCGSDDDGGVNVKLADSTVVMISGWRVGEEGDDEAVMYP